MIPEPLLKVLQHIDTYRERMITDLKDAVAIKSVSGSYKYSGEILKMVKWAEKWLKKLNAKYECFDIGSYEVDGKTIRLPLVILAAFGKDPKKKTICAYCRLDAKDADKKDWKTDPWELHEANRRLYGRGTATGKATLLSWFHCIEGFQAQNVPYPVNVKLIIEGMFEMGSFGMEQFLYTQRLTFIRDIDYICVCESEWINQTLPCISYATVGICQYEVICSSSSSGGSEGSSKTDSNSDVINYIFDNCVDKLGNILIPNVNDDVSQITPDGETACASIRCDLSLIKKNLPDYMQPWDQRKILMRLWRLPSLYCDEPMTVSCNCSGGGAGGEGGGGNGIKRKMILKIVPAQTPDRCNQFVMKHIKNLCEKKFPKTQAKISKGNKKIVCNIDGGKLVVSCENTAVSRPWEEDITSKHYEAVRKAIIQIYKEEPNIIRESIDIPIILILNKV